MPISLIVASPDAHFRETIHENLLNIADAAVVAEFTDIALNLYIRVLHEMERHPTAALVIDLCGDTPEALRALERVKQAAPNMYIIASHHAADAEITIGAMRAGAQEFLIQPLKRSEFRDAITRIERASRRSSSTGAQLGRIYMFLGAKGGVGTTTLAVNFAATAAMNDRRTVLLDLDLRANDAALHLGAHPQYTLIEVAENLNRLDQTLFEGFVARDATGLYLVGPPDNLEHRDFFGGHQFKEFATFLVEKYDVIVIDGGRTPNDDLVMAAMPISAAVFLVVTQDLGAIRNAQRAITFLMRLGMTQDQLKLVINRYTKRPTANLASREQIKETLGQAVYHTVPESPAFLAALNRGRPVVAEPEAQGSEGEQAVRALAAKSLGLTSQAAPERRQPKGFGRFALKR
jgi:pilus assembly protein CpaE